MTSVKLFIVVLTGAAAMACSTNGLSTSTRHDAAADATTDTAPDAKTDTVAGSFCFSGGRTYAIGETFKEDCNTCSCTATGISCTMMLCLHPDAAPDISATPDTATGCVFGGRSYGIGETFKEDCNTCTCTVRGASCTAMACLADAAPDVLPPGSDASACVVSANLTFGYDGGNALYVDVNRLTESSFTVTRTYAVWTGVDVPAPRTCAPTLPACGTANAVTVATINADLADPDVQSLWTLPQSPAPLFGTDPRPVDGAVYSIALANGRKVLVGGQCASPLMSSCRYIPAGLLRLTQDLQKLAAAMVADPACKGL